MVERARRTRSCFHWDKRWDESRDQWRQCGGECGVGPSSPTEAWWRSAIRAVQLADTAPGATTRILRRIGIRTTEVIKSQAWTDTQRKQHKSRLAFSWDSEATSAAMGPAPGAAESEQSRSSEVGPRLCPERPSTHVRHAFLALHGRWQQDHVDQAGFGANIRALRASATPTETDPSYTRESTVASQSAE